MSKEKQKIYKILIVDDKTIERKGIILLINRFNLPLETIEAENGVKALEYIKNNKIDILFTDIRMPFMDGLELIKEVKIINNDIKCIIFSAYGDFDYAKRAIESKCDNYILKPIDVDEFLEVMYKVLMEFEENYKNREEENEIIKNIIRYDVNYGHLHADKPRAEAQIIDNIFESIEKKFFDDLKMEVQCLLKEIREAKIMSALYVKHIIIEIIKRLYIHFDDDDKKNIMELVQKIVCINDMDEMESFTVQAIEQICERIKKLPENVDDQSNIMKFALNIIHNEYMNDISMEQVAEAVCLSPGYFSRVFKKETGYGFVKYLTMYRIEKAKEKLVNTNMKIIDICKESGIPDLSYFCFVFRKYTGISPDEYRKTKR